MQTFFGIGGKEDYNDLVPIVFAGNIKRKMPKEQIISAARLYIEGKLKIANDCANLVNETKAPAVFFGRFDLLVKTLEELSVLEHHTGLFQGSLPSDNLKHIFDQKDQTQKQFIDRYWRELGSKIWTLKTDKAKENKLNGWIETMGIYESKLTDSSKAHIVKLQATKIIK